MTKHNIIHKSPKLYNKYIKYMSTTFKNHKRQQNKYKPSIRQTIELDARNNQKN